MKRNSKYGTALVVGAAAAVVTMVFHPTGHQLLQNAQRIAPVMATVHMLAIMGQSVVFFGTLGLTRVLSRDSEMPIGALVAYGFASMAVMCAAIASGFIGPALAARLVGAADMDRTFLLMLFAYNGAVNQSFANVFVTASSVAIVLWSVAIIRTRILPRSAGAFGALVGAVTLGFQFSGNLPLDVYHFGAVAFAQSAWLGIVGALMIRGDRLESHPPI